MIMKKVLSFYIASAIALTALPFAVNAESVGNTEENVDKIILSDFAQQVITDENMGEILNYRELLDPDNNAIAYCLDFSDGYMILDLYGEIVEYSECSNSPFEDITEDIYYSGPLSYYTKEQNHYVDVCSEDEIPYNMLKETTESFSQISEENSIEADGPENAISLMSLKTTTTTTSDGLRKVKTALTDKPRCFDYYTSPHCGRVAVTTLLFYYYDYINSSILKSSYANNPKSLFNFLGSYIPGNASYSAIKNGLSSAFPKISNSVYDIKTYSNGMTSNEVLTTWNSYMYVILTGKIPAILLLNGHPSYGNHWVVTYGVIAYYDSSNKIVKRQYVVNNGFQKNDIKIGHQYAAGFIHLN